MRLNYDAFKRHGGHHGQSLIQRRPGHGDEAGLQPTQRLLLESQADLLLPLDLGIARCRIVVAAADAEAMTNVQGMIRVATKYAQIARAHFGARGIPVEIIQLSGSVELAPALGLADMIVDLVETGVTLRENGLTVIEEIAESTGRLVVNRASYQLKTEEVARLVKALETVVIAG